MIEAAAPAPKNSSPEAPAPELAIPEVPMAQPPEAALATTENRSPEPSAPVPSDERVFALDVIRGVALLGIFIMNMPSFTASFYSGMVGFHDWPSAVDRVVEVLRNVLMGGKFNSMFSFLFGVGFTLQLMRLRERDGLRANRTYVRRLLALLAFGVLHACLLWTGDVLHIYALLGFLLLLLRNVSNRSIVALIALCVIVPPLVSLTGLYVGAFEDYIPGAEVYQRWQASNNAAYGQGSFLEAAREHTREMVYLYTDRDSLVYVLSFYLQMATTMLIGVLAGRQRWVQNAAQLLPTMIPLQWCALVVGLVTGVFYAYGEMRGLIFSSPKAYIWTSFAYVLCRLGLVTFYVIALLRLCLRSEWRMLLKPIAIVGRMPLSNYLLQTVMATFIFYGWGLGYWNRGTPSDWFELAVLLYVVVQIPVSLLWMGAFKYGPMEYVWRLLTYGREALRRVPASGVEAATWPEDANSQNTRGPMINRDHVVQRTAPVEQRVNAVQAALEERGMPAAQAIEELSHLAEEQWIPQNGARVVAKAWVDPAFRERLFANGRAAVAELGISMPRHHRHLVVLENTATVQNVICCTQCSCTAFTVIGLPPDWYKDLEYRARVVRESRTVLREMGLDLPPEVEIRVWDTTADTRYMVLPLQPAATLGWPEEKLAAIVSRDSMIGVARL
jgi:uncharacterized membrane protein YeiB